MEYKKGQRQEHRYTTFQNVEISKGYILKKDINTFIQQECIELIRSDI